MAGRHSAIAKRPNKGDAGSRNPAVTTQELPFISVDYQPGQPGPKSNIRHIRSELMKRYHRERREQKEQQKEAKVQELLKNKQGDKSGYIVDRGDGEDEDGDRDEAQESELELIIWQAELSPYLALADGARDPFGVLPVSPTPKLLTWVDKWLHGRFAPDDVHPSNKIFDSRARLSFWMPMVIGAYTTFISTMFTSISSLQQLRQEGLGAKPGVEYFFLRGELIRVINENMNHQERAISDSNIGAIMALAFDNHGFGSSDRTKHLAAIREMVRLRGGLRTLELTAPGFNGMIARMIVMQNITTAAMDNTAPTMFPDEPPRLSYHSNHENDTHSWPPRPFLTWATTPSSCLSNPMNLTIRFRDQDLATLSGSTTGSPEMDLESSLAMDGGQTVPRRRKERQALQTSDPILKAISIAANIYTRALISHVPFHDERNQAAVKELHSIFVTTGIDGLWSYMPGVLSWVLTVGGATAMTLASRDLFYKQATRLYIFIKVKFWQDLRVGVMNFVWIAQKVLRLNRLRDQKLVAS